MPTGSHLDRQMSPSTDLARVNSVANITHEIYTISPRPVGYGGFSDIYKAVWRSVDGDMKVAIKVIRTAPSVSRSSEMPRALRHEISVWKRISHPNVHDLCGVCEGLGPAPALVSPWYDNGDINEFVRRRETDPDIALVKLRLFAGVATGLKFLHENHIVHGDIKGGNVLISNDGVARLCDFGLSRLLIEHSRSTTSTGVKGTVRWMAPELLLEDGAHHSYASDNWACGCLFIEVWSNVKPYHTKANDQQVILALSRRERPDRPADMPDMVWLLVEACCNFESVLRPSPSHLVGSISSRLTVLRVYPMVTLNRPIDSAGSDLVGKIVAILRLAHPQQSSTLYTMSDAELVVEVIRLLAISSLGFAELSPLIQDAVHLWCLAKLGTGGLHLPARVSIPDVDGDDFIREFSGSHEPARLRPLARLLAQARPRLGERLMTQFAKPALGLPFRIDTKLWSVAWLPDGDRVVISCGDISIRVLSTASGVTLHRLAGHREFIYEVSVSPDGRLLASCSDDRSIRLWDAATGRAIGTPMIGHTKWVWSVAFSPDGQHIASGSFDETIRVWSTETCTNVLGPLRGHTGSVWTVAYSPDGSRIVSGSSDETVRVWDARKSDPILTIRGHTASVLSVVYSPTGLHIVSGSEDCTVRVWDALTGLPVVAPLDGHSGWVVSAAYSPDGTRIASGSFDGTISIWNTATGAAIATLRGHTDGVFSVAFSPDGRRLASASADGTLRIWDATDDWTHWDI